jgi:hypothetical protein
MSDNSPILNLPYILPAQAQKHVTHNEAIRILDIIVQLAVASRTLTVPPATPDVGDRYIVGAGATGAWAGRDTQIAVWSETGWVYLVPLAGWQAYVTAEAADVTFDGVAWNALGLPAQLPQLGLNAVASATNRLTVAAAATLLNHDGAGHQVKVNKAGVADTASLLFQTGFSGRAEMGLAGNDDFSVKVSADGVAFATALAADAATGMVTLPQPLRLGGQTADPVGPVDGTLWLNTTTGEVKLRTAGSTIVVGAGGGGGGGVADGDKGDVVVSGSGAVWTIDAGAVTLAKMADVASGRLIGRVTAGAGVPEALTAAEVRTLLNVADGAEANVPANLSYDAPSRVLASDTGTDVTLPLAGADAGLMAAADKAKLDGIAAGAEVNVPTNLAYTAGTRVLASSTGADATLPLVTSGEAGLAPASGGGTANFLRADGTWAAPAGGAGALGLADWWELQRLSTGVTVGTPFLQAAISSGTNSTAVPTANIPSWAPHGVFLRSSTTANGGYRYSTGALTADYFGGASHKFRAKLLWRFTTNVTVRIGYLDTTTSADATDGAYFEIIGTACGAKTANNAVRTPGSLIALVVDRVYTFDIDVNAAGTNVRFRIYENLNQTPIYDEQIVTNIPVTAARAFGAGVIATESTTTATDMIVLFELGMGTVEGFVRSMG